MLQLQKLLCMGHILMDAAGDGDGGGGGGGGTPPTFQSMIPESFADKGWLKGIDSMEGLLSKMDGAQNLIGQRSYIPAADANPDHVNEFYGKLRPESSDSYVFDQVDDMPDGLKRTPEAETAIKKIFHDAGLSKHQAGLVQKGYDKFLAENFKNHNSQNEDQLNQEFDTFTNDVFGEKKDQALANSKALMEKFVPESAKQHLAGLDNKALLILASVLDGVHQEYVAQDGGGGGGDGGGFGDGYTSETADNRIAAIRAELDKYDIPALHPKFKVLNDEMQKIYKWKVEKEKKTS